MSRLDFEKQFARQLKDRELEPSIESWEKLQGRLELKQKKNSPLFWWIGMAASIVGTIFILNFAFNSPQVENTTRIVDVEIDEKQDKMEPHNSSIPQVASQESEEAAKVDNQSGPIEDPVSDSTLPEADSKESMAASQTTSESTGLGKNAAIAAATEDDSKNINSALATEGGPGKESITDAELEALLQEAIAEVSKEMREVGKVTDDQIEALLAEARAEVGNERVMYQTAAYDADNLLLEVETELEHSFRQQVFELIKDGLQKTRNAVVNINQ